MKRNLWIVAILGLQLVGCGTNVKPQPSAPVVESSLPAEVPAVVIPDIPAMPVPIPPAPTKQPVQAPAVATNAIASLAVQARAHYQAKNYQAAIAIAERGLRIDRRAPELYLLLAQSYIQLANTQLAQQFVQQGIRYAQVGSEVAQKLLKVRDSLAH